MKLIGKQIVVELPESHRGKPLLKCFCGCGGFLVRCKEGMRLKNNESRKKYLRKLYAKMPWAKTWIGINKRCRRQGSYYVKYGIKNFLTKDDLKYLWFRDKPYLMSNPSIDRINPDEHYTLENCQYLECAENSRKKRSVLQKKSIGKMVRYNGEDRTIFSLAKTVGLDPATLRHRLKSGWQLIEALSIKPNRRNRSTKKEYKRIWFCNKHLQVP